MSLIVHQRWSARPDPVYVTGPTKLSCPGLLDRNNAGATWKRTDILYIVRHLETYIHTLIHAFSVGVGRDHNLFRFVHFHGRFHRCSTVIGNFD